MKSKDQAILEIFYVAESKNLISWGNFEGKTYKPGLSDNTHMNGLNQVDIFMYA